MEYKTTREMIAPDQRQGVISEHFKSAWELVGIVDRPHDMNTRVFYWKRPAPMEPPQDGGRTIDTSYLAAALRICRHESEALRAHELLPWMKLIEALAELVPRW